MNVLTGGAESTNHALGPLQANPYFLDSLTRQVIALADPERIVLFGSRAQGTARADSDYDLYVESDIPRSVLLGRVRTPLDVDWVIRDREFFAARKRENHPIARAIEEGVTLYDKRAGETVQVWPMLSGADGTFQALQLMAAATRGECAPDFSGYQDEFNIRAAGWVIGNVGNTIDPMAALFYFCRDQIAYLDHPFNTQQVQDCRRTLERRTGDCVSKSVCLATLLATQGIVSRFVAQSLDGEEYTHVYVEAWRDGHGWIGLDPVANGTEGRPLGDVGWRQQLPDGGFESTQEIF